MKANKLLILLFAVTISSCHRIHDGSVTDKYVVPAHSYTYYTTSNIGKVSIMTPHTGYVGDQYVLSVTNVVNGDTLTEDFLVKSDLFYCKDIGSYFNDTLPCEIYEAK